jgi:hypothetical protein
MPSLPSSLALTSIPASSEILSADHRNNYTAIQTAVNALIAALSSGSAGQLLSATSSSAVAWATALAPSVRVYHDANQAITTGVSTALSFNTERFDTASGAADTQHDTVTNNSRLTCRYAGNYLIVASVGWNAVAAGTYRQVAIRMNGATTLAYTTGPPTSAGICDQVVTTMYTLAVNDYVQCFVAHDRGSNLDINAAGNYSPEFMMVKVG